MPRRGEILCAGSGCNPEPALFTYDAVGNLLTYNNGDISGTLTYDALNRKLTETVNYGTFSKNYSYTYDARGNKATYTSPEGVVYSYAYNLTQRPISITFNGNTITFEYFKNRLLKTTFPNGITSDYLFNANSWLTNILTKQGVTPLSSFQYSFDNVGNVTNKNTEQGNTAYSYDIKYQLTDSVSLSSQEPFTYDAAGNRLTDTSTPTGLTFGTTQFYYNARNRLERVTLPDGRIATYTYDPFGRRIKKTITPPPPAGGGVGEGIVTFYAYSDEGLIGEYSSTGALIKAYGWKPNSTWGTDPVFMVESNQHYFYHNDHLGTPQRLTDINGNTVWSATYTAFGEANVNSGSTLLNNLRFPGQYYDEETSLHYNWNRYYNPKTGRYTQEDPIGFGGGDENLYRYVLNNPIYFLDNIGLKPGDKFNTAEQAAIDAIQYINPTSVSQSSEYGGWITKNKDGTYYYSEPTKGTKDGMPNMPKKGKDGVAWYHTHGSNDPGYYNEIFSNGDKGYSLINNSPGYLGTPGGQIKKYDPFTGKDTTIGQCPTVKK